MGGYETVAIRIVGVEASASTPINDDDARVVFTLSADPSEQWIATFDDPSSARDDFDDEYDDVIPPGGAVIEPGKRVAVQCSIQDVPAVLAQLREYIEQVNERVRLDVELERERRRRLHKVLDRLQF